MAVLCDIARCTGCTACASICPNHCITMQPDAEGFLRPVTDQDSCVDCGLCSLVCPVLHPRDCQNTETIAYAAVNRDDTVRMHSTSGGIFALLCRWIFDHGGVVFGAAYTDSFTVEHRMVTSMDDMIRLQSAKYAQSALRDVFLSVQELLGQGRYVLFSGTPCQTSGLSAYLGKSYERLILVDLICHGVPSPSVWTHYLEYRSRTDAENARPASVNLRSKETGWPGYSVKIQYENGNVYLAKNAEDPYIRSFVGNLSLRPSCYHCQFKGFHRCSDFTLGDYWGVWSQMPSFHDGRGTSLVLVHSEKGRHIWSQLAASVSCLETDSAQCFTENPSALFPSPLPEIRSEFFATYQDQDFQTLVDALLPRPNPSAPQSMFKRAIRKLRRILYKA